MKALILGAGGQVGRALAAAAPAGAEIVAADRATCDIRDPDAVRALIARAAPDLLFNAAAYTAVDRAETDVEAATAINADAPPILARLAREAGARFVQLSTDFVFDGRQSRPYRPQDPPAPLSVYGRTKLAGERGVQAGDPDALIVRTAWVHGAGGANFMRTMLRLMRERERLEVVSDQIGTPTHARSLARALWALVGRGAAGIHHYTDAGVASWYDFAVAIGEEAHAAGLLDRIVPIRPIATRDYPTPAARPPFAVLDTTSAWTLLGGAPAHWRVELRAAIEELRAHG